MSGIPQIDGFEIIGLLGKGGMATVWKARQICLDRMLAVKILNSNLAADADDVRRFTEEARAAARLRHPGIVQVIEAGVSHGNRYFAMELVTGYTVGEWLRRKRHGLGEQQALVIAEYLVAALDYAYSSFGMIHCDIKPDNIMVHGDGTIKLMDLGLARMSVAGRRTTETDILGTPAYMSPEQARGDEDLDCRADIYSLGATLYHIATGKMLFTGKSDEETMSLQQTGTVPDAMSLDPAISPQFCQLLEKMMAKDRHNRQTNWGGVAHDIKAVAAHRAISGLTLAPGLSTMERCQQRADFMAAAEASKVHAIQESKRRFPWGAVVFAIAVAALAAVGVKGYKAWQRENGNGPAATHQTMPETQAVQAAMPPQAETSGASEPENPTEEPQPAPVTHPAPTSQPVPSTQPASSPASSAAVSATQSPKPHVLPDNEESRELKSALKWVRENPDDAKGAIDRMEQVVRKTAACEQVQAIAKKKLDELRDDFEYQVRRARKSLESRAGNQADWKLYGAAIDILENYDGPAAEELADWRKSESDKWRKEAAARAKDGEISAIRATADLATTSATPPQRLAEMADKLLAGVAADLMEFGVPHAMSEFDSSIAKTQELQRVPAIQDVAKIFVAYADAPEAYLAKYRDRVGETIWLELRDTDVSGEIVKVHTDGVTLHVTPKEKPAYTKAYPFSALHPNERIRAIGGNGTRAGAMMLGLQGAHSGQTQQAKAQFANMPPAFRDALLASLQERNKR